MNFYNKHILPKLLNSVMGRVEMEGLRPGVVGEARGVILEIGFGSGLNLSYYKDIIKLYALEPSVELYGLGRERIASTSFPVEALHASAEAIPLADNSLDGVVSTWTLCSIPHPEIALKEISRVLKPGGVFTFIEHGKSPKNFVAKFQKWSTPLSKRLAGGCHMDREIDTLVAQAGFRLIKLKKFEQKSKPLAYMYQGVAMVNTV